MATEIKIAEGGPYLVSGDIKLVGSDGKDIDVSGKPMVALCRCGKSSTLPFCNGSHKEWTPAG